jgi:hypothetical protein
MCAGVQLTFAAITFTQSVKSWGEEKEYASQKEVS